MFVEHHRLYLTIHRLVANLLIYFDAFCDRNAFLLNTIFELFTNYMKQIVKFVLSGVVYSIPRILS